MPPGPWTMVFDDEFSGNNLDTSKWNYCYESSGVSCTAEKDASPQNCIVQNAELDLELSVPSSPSDPNHPYNSCFIQTHGKFDFTYGFVEATIWFSKGNDSWPAFWMLPSGGPNNGPPEFDIAEQWGGGGLNPEQNYWWDPQNEYSNANGYGIIPPISNPSGSWHTYAVDWEPGVATFFEDGVKTGSYSTNIYSGPMYLILDLAIASWHPNPQVPDNVYVKSVRVYQHNANYLSLAG